MEKTPVFELNASVDELKNIAEKVCGEIEKSGEFCLWLDAPMGAGKTTLTRYILWTLGLSKETAVTSPTYTYLNEYHINSRWIAHLDLYRLSGADNLYELGLEETRPFKGYIVEWPDAVDDPDPLHPTHILKIHAGEQDSRTYSFFKVKG